MGTREFAIAKKGKEDIVRRMFLDPKKEYLVLERTKYEDSSEVLGLKTESGNKLSYDASFFDIRELPEDLSERVLEDK
jgi:hypothetical protein